MAGRDRCGCHEVLSRQLEPSQHASFSWYKAPWYLRLPHWRPFSTAMLSTAATWAPRPLLPGGDNLVLTGALPNFQFCLAIVASLSAFVQ